MDTTPATLLCFAHGRASDWEAICVDLDIAVQGDSFDDVKALLDEAVHDYIEEACKEAPPVREKLLNRRAPWHVLAGLTLKLVWFNIFRGRRSEAQASFPVACHA